jgi:ABC-type multidrug transport system fused ATPase/permease subunit
MHTKKYSWKVVLIVGLITVILATVTGRFVVYFAERMVTIAQDVLKSLVDANTGLLGFLGVITVFALATMRDSRNRIEEQIYRAKIEHERNIQSTPLVVGSSDPRESFEGMLDAEYKAFTERIEKLENQLQSTKRDAKTICIFTVAAASLFVVSILLCLLGMSQVAAETVIDATFYACGTMLAGVILIFGIVLGVLGAFH